MSELHPPQRSHSRLVMILIAVALLTTLTAVGIAGLVAGPPTPGETTSEPTAPAFPSATPNDPEETWMVDLPVTADPVRYATAVAETLFAWDTRDGLPPATYLAALHNATAAEGPESNGLYHDLANYLPDEDAWATLAGMQARQWLEVGSAAIPAGWAEAAQQPSVSRQTVAITIDGTRHREGVWAGQPTRTASPVAFTLFLSCPSGGRCSLLRLTLPDAPLR